MTYHSQTHIINLCINQPPSHCYSNYHWEFCFYSELLKYVGANTSLIFCHRHRQASHHGEHCSYYFRNWHSLCKYRKISNWQIQILKKYMGQWWIAAKDIKIYKVYYQKTSVNYYVKIQWMYHIVLNSVLTSITILYLHWMLEMAGQ